jgi:hypothetical protein
VSQEQDNATDANCEMDAWPEEPHGVFRGVMAVVVFYLVVLAVLVACCAGCRTKTTPTERYPVPQFLDPVTEETPNVRR